MVQRGRPSGQITKLKLVKPQMCGLAKLDLIQACLIGERPVQPPAKVGVLKFGFCYPSRYPKASFAAGVFPKYLKSWQEWQSSNQRPRFWSSLGAVPASELSSRFD